jgi:hypothetical protein
MLGEGDRDEAEERAGGEEKDQRARHRAPIA